MTRRGRRPTVSLFGQLLTLTGLTLVAAQAVSLVLIFSVPSPVPDFYRLPEIAQAFHGAPPVFVDRKPLEVITLDKPSRMMKGPYVKDMREALAEEMGVPAARIVISGERGPFWDRRVSRILRHRMARNGVSEDEHFLLDPFQVAVQRTDGRWVTVQPRPSFGLNPWQQRIALWFVLAALAMAPITYIFARRLSAPFRLFADAAERLGRDPKAPPLEVSGSSEIAVAADAFNDMQQRLRRYVEDRTAMVGAIAHDLRTPLTRLRFRVETLSDDEQKAKIVADITQMEEMISAALTFVRDATREGERTPLELSSLLESLCDEMAETGLRAEVETGDKVVLDGDPMALRRLFANLLDNAVKFGSTAHARVFRDGRMAVVEIEDDGPGIPPQDADRVFEPFYRREPSRSRQTGGIGLGLAVVRSVARAHGGDVVLENRPAGGLRARVILPV
ncbi:ATP-binding protein [Phenylobacterium sp.]|jgi:two-component system OmpR family sensor kinase|uniref:ATP-binding protein n=1 Tax=Phenylobacterium sp. TaxID=1871053 RepID=UPI0037847EC5